MECVPYQFWNWKRNNGDGITADILRNVFDVEPVYADQSQTHLMGVGSILALSNRNSHVWGSGVLDPKSEMPPVPREQIHAVRGWKTLQWLERQGVAGLDVPLGDPGILVDTVVARQGLDPTIRHTIALVPHHDEIGSDWVRRLRNRRDICLIDMMDNTLRPVEQILQAEIVVSQSLHGLIFAEALGKPNLWISTTRDGLWCWKFEDWFSTTREPQLVPVPVTASVAEWLSQARLHDCAIDRDALKAAFPRAHLARPGRFLMPYAACRAIDALQFALPEPLFPAARAASDFSDKEIEALQWRIGEIANRVFSSFSEPTYLCLHDGAELPTPELLARATRLLDEHGKCQFALLRKADQPLSGGPHIQVSDTLEAGQRVMDGALLLRPCRWFSPRAKHLVITW